MSRVSYLGELPGRNKLGEEIFIWLSVSGYECPPTEWPLRKRTGQDTVFKDLLLQSPALDFYHIQLKLFCQGPIKIQSID